ncbi:MAG: inorganic phosphate transporter family protein [Spirochaetes bacterium]|nr:inorganic phosphate transporter family protein [Spirochaetota bacterium]
MDPISLIAIVVCVLLAVNVGGNNSAAEMGPAFGAQVRSKREAVILIAVFSMMGALFAGDSVVQTIGKDIIPGTQLENHYWSVIIILFSAASLIAIANFKRVPVATAHAMVGSVVGAGLFFGGVNWPKMTTIITWWLVTPLLSLFVSYLLGRYACEKLKVFIEELPAQKTVQFLFRGFITVSGCYMAFSAGSNSLAKAVGPMVGSGILTSKSAAVLGGLGMATGAFMVGHRLLHTVGKGITEIDPIKAVLVELVCGSIVLTASHSGVPVSLAEIITCSVIGFGCARSGIREIAKNPYVKTIYKLWPVCPLFTAVLTFGLSYFVKIFISV